MRRPLILLTLAALLLASSAAASRYTLRRGDTLGGVARRLGVSVDALARANGIKNPDRILAGQVLVVPPKNAPPPKSAAKAAKPVAVAAPPAPAMKPIVDAHLIATGASPAYTVVKGDTGGAIAKRNNVKLSALANANPAINIDRLEVGMVLTLPLESKWICPVQGKKFWRDDWGANRPQGAHMGNDIVAARGTPVVAPVGGTLELRQGKIGGNAFYVRGDDGNTYYGAHLDAYGRGPGRIEAGQQIGSVGDTGDAKGGVTHLHFEFHPQGGAAVDPYYTLVAWC